VTGVGKTLTDARNQAYQTISTVNLDKSFYRSDIALKASEEK
jgi:phosphoribosylamine--glycine ligase